MDIERIKQIVRKLDKISNNCQNRDFYIATYLYIRYGISNFENYIDSTDLERISKLIRERTTIFDEELNYQIDKILNTKELECMKTEIDNYTEKELLENYKTLTGLEKEDMNTDEIRQYLKDYWKEQIYRDEKIYKKEITERWTKLKF